MSTNTVRWGTAKECAYLAVFVALVIGVQLAFAAIPGVELVTVLFVAYSFVFGIKRGMLAAIVFSVLRQLVFGIYVNVLVLYLIYYNLLTFFFGWLGNRQKRIGLWCIVLCACLFTVGFTLTDNVITIWINGLTANAARIYMYASLSVMITQTICVGVSVGVLFLPIKRTFQSIKKRL